MSDDDKLPAGALLEVTMTIRLPIAATDQDVDQWLKFNLGQRGGMPSASPLIDESPDPFGVDWLTWDYAGFVGREEKRPASDTNCALLGSARHEPLAH